MTKTWKPYGTQRPAVRPEVLTTRFDLAGLMRAHKVTIRELSRRMNVTIKAIRKYRGMDRVSYLIYCDYSEGVTGVVVFNRARYDAMCMQGLI